MFVVKIQILTRLLLFSNIIDQFTPFDLVIGCASGVTGAGRRQPDLHDRPAGARERRAVLPTAFTSEMHKNGLDPGGDYPST